MGAFGHRRIRPFHPNNMRRRVDARRCLRGRTQRHRAALRAAHGRADGEGEALFQLVHAIAVGGNGHHAVHAARGNLQRAGKRSEAIGNAGGNAAGGEVGLAGAVCALPLPVHLRPHLRRPRHVYRAAAAVAECNAEHHRLPFIHTAISGGGAARHADGERIALANAEHCAGFAGGQHAAAAELRRGNAHRQGFRRFVQLICGNGKAEDAAGRGRAAGGRRLRHQQHGGALRRFANAAGRGNVVIAAVHRPGYAGRYPGVRRQPPSAQRNGEAGAAAFAQRCALAADGGNAVGNGIVVGDGKGARRGGGGDCAAAGNLAVGNGDREGFARLVEIIFGNGNANDAAVCAGGNGDAVAGCEVVVFGAGVGGGVVGICAHRVGDNDIRGMRCAAERNGDFGVAAFIYRAAAAEGGGKLVCIGNGGGHGAAGGRFGTGGGYRRAERDESAATCGRAEQQREIFGAFEQRIAARGDGDAAAGAAHIGGASVSRIDGNAAAVCACGNAAGRGNVVIAGGKGGVRACVHNGEGNRYRRGGSGAGDADAPGHCSVVFGNGGGAAVVDCDDEIVTGIAERNRERCGGDLHAAQRRFCGVRGVLRQSQSEIFLAIRAAFGQRILRRVNGEGLAGFAAAEAQRAAGRQAAGEIRRGDGVFSRAILEAPNYRQGRAVRNCRAVAGDGVGLGRIAFVQTRRAGQRETVGGGAVRHDDEIHADISPAKRPPQAGGEVFTGQSDGQRLVVLCQPVGLDFNADIRIHLARNRPCGGVDHVVGNYLAPRIKVRIRRGAQSHGSAVVRLAFLVGLRCNPGRVVEGDPALRGVAQSRPQQHRAALAHLNACGVRIRIRPAGRHQRNGDIVVVVDIHSHGPAILGVLNCPVSNRPGPELAKPQAIHAAIPADEA